MQQSTFIVALVIYLGILLAMGIYFGLKNKNASDFLVGSHSLPTWAIVLTLTASIFGGGMLVGGAQNGYNGGTFYLFGLLWTLAAYFVVAWLISKMKGFSSYRTVTEYLEVRYHSKFVRVSCALLSMVCLVGLTAGQVSSLVSCLSSMGLGNPTIIAFFCMLIIIALTVVGGFLAVTATDCFQIILCFLGMFTLVFLIGNGHGGWGNIFATLNEMQTAGELPEGFMSGISADVPRWFWIGLPGMLYLMVGQDLYERLFGCKNLHESRKAAIIAGFATAALGVPGILYGMVARIDFPELALTEGGSMMALASMIQKYMPGALGAFFLCAVLSAILSTGDSCLTAATSHFINDVWLVLFDKEGDLKSKHMLTVSRVFTLVAGAFALFISFKITSLVDSMVICYYLYTGAAVAPILVGVLWKGANKYGAAAGVVVGVAATFAGLGGLTVGPLTLDLFATLAAIVTVIVVSLLTKNKVPAEEASES